VSSAWQARVDAEGIWRRCRDAPDLVFGEEELAWLRGIRGRRVAVLGSGDNLAVFALAGLGAEVTSIDISQEQLACGADRARELGLNIHFVRADVTALDEIPTETFDAVYTGGHVAVWVSDLDKYYAEAARILVSGGLFIVSEYHPFRRIFRANAERYEIETRYLNRGPYEYDRADENALGAAMSEPLPSFESHWTVGDFLNAVIGAGCDVLACREFGGAVAVWEGLPSGDIPETLLIVSRKRLAKTGPETSGQADTWPTL